MRAHKPDRIDTILKWISWVAMATLAICLAVLVADANQVLSDESWSDERVVEEHSIRERKGACAAPTKPVQLSPTTVQDDNIFADLLKAQGLELWSDCNGVSTRYRHNWLGHTSRQVLNPGVAAELAQIVSKRPVTKSDPSCPLTTEMAQRHLRLTFGDNGTLPRDPFPHVKTWVELNATQSPEEAIRMLRPIQPEIHGDLQHLTEDDVVNVRWCTMASCFNSSHPPCVAAARKGGPIPAYFYQRHGKNGTFLDRTCSRPGLDTHTKSINEACRYVMWGSISGKDTARSDLMQMVDNPDDACVFVDTPGPEADFHIVSNLSHWSAAGDGGTNHILVSPNCMEHCDRVFLVKNRPGPIGKAMLFTSSLLRGLYRPGFDISIPWSMTPVAATTSSRGTEYWRQQNRTLLAGMRATTIISTNRWFTSRAALSIYAQNRERGLVFDLSFPNVGKHPHYPRCPYKWDHQFSYVDLLAKSHFQLAPGGGGP